jgi:peptidoglycan/xylan/chitin deacetylase (PgdA/CDA1 family)
MLHGRQKTTPRRVCLTFDDGPCAETTPHLLDHLQELGIKATFFVVGRNMENAQGRAIVDRMAAEGHQIGNHTYSHLDLTRLDAARIEQEIKKTEDLIGSRDNGNKVFRAPFGFHNAVVDRAAAALGYKSVLWDLCAWDWRPYYQNRRWVSHIVRQIEAGREGIVLAHDVIPSTVAHVPELISALRDLPGTEFALVA